MYSITLALDVYGTMINPAAVINAAKQLFPEETAENLVSLWRQKQLEYTFRRAAMETYADFSVVTKEALHYALSFLRVELSESQCQLLMYQYLALPVYPGVLSFLQQWHRRIGLYAFSNGKPEDLDVLLARASLKPYLDDIISVDPVRTYKPSRKVYEYFLHKVEVPPSETYLISANPFDIVGARQAGMQAVWLRESSASILDTWGLPPNYTVKDFSELDQLLRGTLSKIHGLEG